MTGSSLRSISRQGAFSPRTLIFMCLGAIPMMSAFSPVDSGAATERFPTYIEAKCGDMQFRYDLYNGVLLDVRDMQMIRGNSLFFVKPGWTGRVYGLEDNPRIFENAVVKKSDSMTTIVLTFEAADAPNPPIVGTQTITLSADNSIRFRLAFRMTQDVAALLEWGVGQMAAAPMLGAAFKGETAKGKVEGIIPVECPGPTIEESTVAKAIRRLEIQSRLGPIVIEANDESKLLFFDYRKNRWAQEDKPIFWLGHYEDTVKAGKDYVLEATLRFPPRNKPASQTAEPEVQTARTKKISKALMPLREERPLIPTPKSYNPTKDRMPLSGKTRIYLGATPSPEVEQALGFFLRDLKEMCDIAPDVIREDPPARPPKGSILLSVGTGKSPAADFCAEAGLKPPDSEEGYRLRVTRNAAAIAAPNPRALFYGFTTLAQLIQVDENGVSLRGAEIVDYPSLPFRGIHCHSSAVAPDEIIRAERELMARFKINKFVFECSHMIWDSHPEIAHPRYGMKKEDGRRIAKAAGENFLEIIPLVQSLGHCEWIFTNDKNLDIAEDPETPYAYCPTNLRSYDFIFSVYQEALDLFKPRVFHIGHDEVSMRGRFPYRSKDSGKTAAELIVDDINKLHAWFTNRGVRIMMWGDVFLAPGESPDATNAPSVEEAAKRRAALPRDAFIADWHYDAAPPEAFKSLGIWRQEGFDAVGASWFSPVNIQNLTQAAIKADQKGLLQTTWAGYNFQINDNESSWYQYMMYIYAAHCAWSGDTTPYEQLPWTVRDVFLRTWFARKPLLHPSKGFQIDLSAAANRSFADNDGGSGWLGYGPDYDMAAFPAAQERFDETAFLIKKNAKGDSALLLSGSLNPAGQFPESVELRLDRARQADEMRFLLATAFPGREKIKVGAVTLVYDDGSTASLDLVYGKNIFGCTENRVGREARIAWSAVAKGNGKRYMFSLAWANPNPEKKIAALRLSSAGTEAAPVFLAITGVEKGQ